jgi:tetratricopeptide (TPR) repeat protein
MGRAMPCNRRLAPVLLLCMCAQASARTTSAEDDPVLAGYQQFYAGDLDAAQQTFEKLTAAQPGRLAPEFGALQILEQRSDTDKKFEAEFERRLDAFVAAAQTRVDRSDKDDEALFYLANAHMLRASYRLDHDKGVWGAARDGARAKRLSEQYVQRHPEHGDAYFALGTYNYYVEIAPTFIKVLRLFLFLPSGNRAVGLEQLERAYRQGSLLAPQAGVTLMEIYGGFESRPADGLRIGERLAAQYPENPKIQFSLAELYESPAIEDFERAAATYERIIAYEDHRPGRERPAKYQARLGLSSARFSRWRVDESLAVLDDLIARQPAEPAWVMPNALLRRANYRALLNRADAEDDLKAVLAQERWKDWHKAANDRVSWMQRRRGSGEADVYASLIAGNRLMALRQWDAAAAAYEQVRAHHPDDPQVRFRLALVAFRRGNAERALPEFNAVANAPTAPDWLKAQAVLHAARAHDLANRRPEAVKLYQRVTDRYDTESAAWAAKVGLVSPYKLPMSVQ